jgi:hypothetical protein
LFDDGVERGSKILLAYLQEAGCIGMAIEETAVAQAVLLDDGLGSLPNQEVEFDGLTVFVIADSAFALMTERSAVGRFGWRLAPTTVSTFIFVSFGLSRIARLTLT